MTNIKFSLNNKLNNQKIFNIRNFLLIFIPLSFLIFSFAVLYIQRNESLQIIHNLDTYIIIALVFIFILFVYLGNLIIPIILRVRRKKISSLNSKFTLYFISIALTPALLLGLLGTILINMGINDWFNSKIKNVINNSVIVAESYLDEHRETIKGDVYAMYNDLNDSSDIFLRDNAKLLLALRTQAMVRSLPETYILNREGEIENRAFDNNVPFYTPPESAFMKADQGEMTIMSSTQVNKVYALVKLNSLSNSYLFVGRSMDANVLSALNDTVSAKNEYTFLEESRDQISIIFILIYIIVSLILILLSTFIGIKLAERIVMPISSVIRASNNISKGTYGDKIQKTNDYIELNRLVDSFNKMSSDIQKQRKQIIISKKHETWSDIARRIAHEIKNPLTPIQLSSERLEKKIKELDIDKSEINECINIITRQVNEIGYLVDEFSNFARLPEPNLNKNDIFKILKDCVKDHEENDKKIVFSNRLHVKEFYVNIDSSQISRVFKNIIQNSIQSINEMKIKKGLIEFFSKEDDNSLIISIKDNGCGLKYDKDDIVKPYFTTKKKSGGTGLGLAIVEKILFDHHADFIIENRRDDKIGAIVTMKFDK